MRVLIVDDEVDHAELLAEFVGSCGHEAAIAGSAADARALVSNHSFELILVDFRLPDGRGEALVAELRDRGVRSRIVAATASGSKAERERGEAAGIDAFLLKPFTLAQVRAQLDLASGD